MLASSLHYDPNRNTRNTKSAPLLSEIPRSYVCGPCPGLFVRTMHSPPNLKDKELAAQHGWKVVGWCGKLIVEPPSATSGGPISTMIVKGDFLRICLWRFGRQENSYESALFKGMVVGCSNKRAKQFHMHPHPRVCGLKQVSHDPTYAWVKIGPPQKRRASNMLTVHGPVLFSRISHEREELSDATQYQS